MTRRLQPIGAGIWQASGPELSFLGIPYPTRMVVVRLATGKLWVWSPVAMDAELETQLRELGDVAFAVEPNKLHHLALAEWKERWPELRLWAPPGLAKKRRDLEFEPESTGLPPPPWATEIECQAIEGSFIMTEVLYFHCASRTCMVGDLIQKHDANAMKTWQRWMMEADGLAGRDGSTPGEWRLTFVQRQRARECMERVLAWNPDQVVIAHGPSPLPDGARVLRESMGWLLEG